MPTVSCTDNHYHSTSNDNHSHSNNPVGMAKSKLCGSMQKRSFFMPLSRSKSLIIKAFSLSACYDNKARVGYRQKAKTSPASILQVLAVFPFGIGS